MVARTTSRAGRRRRLGWLLRCNRVHGGRAAHRGLREFRDSFARLGPGAVSVSTLSRWENGLGEPTYDGVRRYERVLGLRPHSLVTVFDTVSRYRVPPGRSAPLLARPAAAAGALDELLDRGRNGDIMSAGDWDRLTAIIAGNPSLRLYPASAWTDIAGRLLTELSVSDGFQWMPRAEALNRLMAHPVGQDAAIATAAEAAADRGVQSLIGTVTVLDASAHPAASAHVVRHVLRPVTARTFYGGLLAGVKKLRFGHLDLDQSRLLLPVLLELMGDAGHLPQARLAACLVRAMPGALTRRVGDRHWRLLRELLGPDPADPVVERVCTEAAGALSPAGPRDPVLAELVSEVLHDPVFDVRLYACFLIYATPYRQPVADALGRVLARELRGGAHAGTRITLLLEALRVLGGPAQRRAVERLLLWPGLGPVVANSAAYALGHVGGSSSTGYWLRLTEVCLRRCEAGRSADADSVLDRVVYALGMSDRADLLRRVRADPRCPDGVRRAADWWLGLPSYVLRGVRI